MSRTIFFGLWAAWGVTVALALTFAMIGIWFDSDKAGSTAGVFGLPALFGLVGLIPMTVVDGIPPRGLPRSARRQLRDEQARIALEAAIARAEREAGIR